jgi:hypothetical protein
VLIGPSIYYPVPGTALFDICRNEEVLPPSFSMYRSSAFPVQTSSFDRIDLITLFRLVRVANFIKGRIDAKMLPEGISLKELCRMLQDKTMLQEAPEAHSARGMPDRFSRRVKVIPWQELLFMLLAERSLFCLQKVADGGIMAVKAAQSRKVLDYFLETLWLNPIRGSRVDS